MMSLESKGRFAIWKRTSSPTGVRIVRKNITRYLDERTKAGIDVTASQAQNHPNWLKEGVDYLTKEDQGKLKVYGFLRDDVIRRTGQFPHRMKNDDLVAACLEAWEARLRRKKIKRVAHKYVLALSPELCEVMAKTGHSADELLTQAVRKTMRKYQEKYYPADKVGYLVGIHHDKAHLHAHVMLFPTTDSGKLLLVTDYSRKDKLNRHKRPFTEMRKFAEQEVARFYHREIKNPFRASERNPAKYVQPKLLSLAAYGWATAKQKAEKLTVESRNTLHHQEYERSLQGSPQELRAALEDGYAQAAKLFNHLEDCKKDKKNPATYESFCNRIKDNSTDIDKQLKALRAQINELKAESQNNHKIRRRLYRDMSNWSHFRFNRRAIADGGSSLRDHEVGDWINEQLVRSDTLGDLIRTWVDEKKGRNEAINLPQRMLQAIASADNPAAAQKFTERDKYARKCITYGSERIKDRSLNMLSHFYGQSAFLSNHSQKDFVREFLKGEVRVHRDQMKDIQQRREDLSRRIKELRLQQQANRLKLDIILDVDKGYTPSFLQEYKYWKDVGIETPTQSLQALKASRSQKTQAGSDTKGRQTADDFSSRVASALQKLRTSRMQAEPFSVAARISAQRETATNPAAEMNESRTAVLDNSLNSNAEQFLRSHRDTAKRVDQENEKSLEDRRLEVRERHMQQEGVSVLDR